MTLRAHLLARGASATIAAFAVLGCGQYPGAEEDGVARSAVIGGKASPSQQDATVMINYGGPPKCTGVVVAPTLVLTSRSCLFTLPGEANGAFYTNCSADNIGAPLVRAIDPGDFTISVGTMPGPRRTEAKGVRFYAGADLDLCANDIALIEVDTPLSPAPLAMRLDAGPHPMEHGELVGWGVTDDTEKSPQVRQQRDVQVLQIGNADYQIPHGRVLHVNAGSFITGEGGCFSDQGGPFLAGESDSVVGILSSDEPRDADLAFDAGVAYCRDAYSVYSTLAAQSQLIRDAFVRANQVPWLEGQPPLAAAGQSCVKPGDCISGVCKSTTDGIQFCSQGCSSDACPQGLQCVGTSGERWCVPTQVPSDNAESARCSVAFERRDCGGWLALALLGLVGLRVRRSRLVRFHSSKPFPPRIDHEIAIHLWTPRGNLPRLPTRIERRQL